MNDPNNHDTHERGRWAMDRPQSSGDWLRLIVTLLVVVLLLGGICLYFPALFAGPDAGTGLLRGLVA